MIVFFDLETGGVEDHHPNIQIAAIAVDRKWNELSSFEQKISFDEAAADPEALRINSYEPELWRTARPEGVVMQEFCRWLEGFRSVEKVSARTGRPYRVARLAGHNVARFDHPRLLTACQKNDLFLPACFYVLDTFQLAAWYFDGLDEWPENLRLGTLCGHFGIQTAELHDAMADVRANIELAKVLTG